MSQDEREGLPSCSNIDRYVSCPGAWALEQHAPPAPTNEDAESGTRIHAWLAGDLPKDGMLTDHEQDTANRCRGLASEAADACGVPDGCTPLIEQRFWLTDRNGTKVFSGKADRVFIWVNQTGNGLIACIIDYKTGRGDVDPAPSNGQLKGLVACLKSERPALDEAFTAVVGPFQDKPISIAKFEYEDLKTAMGEIFDIETNLRDPKAPRIAGPQCRYCRCKPICPEHQALAMEPVPALVPVAGQPTKKSVEAAAQLLPTDKLAGYLENLEVREWANDAIRAEAKRRILAGVPVPGWQLGKPQAREKVTDTAGVYAKAQPWCPADAFANACTITKKALEALVRTHLGHKGKTLETTVDELVAGCVTVTLTEPPLQRMDGEAQTSLPSSLPPIP